MGMGTQDAPSLAVRFRGGISMLVHPPGLARVGPLPLLQHTTLKTKPNLALNPKNHLNLAPKILGFSPRCAASRTV
jgi:hypothetical protein